MRFRVTGISDIMCTKCKGTTRVAPKKFYNTDDLTCNCSENSSVGKFEVTSISDIICAECAGATRVVPEKTYYIKKLECICGKEDVTDEDVGTGVENPPPAAPTENPKQTKMFEEEPENVINPSDSDMTEEEVAEYLKSLGWQELLEAARNNEVTKPPSANRKELEKLILEKVFHE